MQKKTTKKTTPGRKPAVTKKKPTKLITPSMYLSTGSTLLNLALSDKHNCGFVKGRYFFLVGDSASGKTWLALTCFAESQINKNFQNYRLIFDNAEDGALMDLERYFGKKTADKIEPPAGTREEPVYSETVEDFYFNIDDALSRGEPFIYVLDSMDALSSKDEEVKFQKIKKAAREGKEEAGIMSDGKAKKNSANLRRVIGKLRRSGSILIIINQTRDNLGLGFEKKTRSGGRSLRFYATLEMWTSVKQKLKKTVNGKPRTIGVVTSVTVKKNRLTGKDRTVDVPIYNSIGMDDVGACIDYLIEEKHWRVVKNTIKATDFDFEGSKTKLIRHIEEEGLEDDLACIVEGVWKEVEAQCEVRRKNKYSTEGE